MKIEVNNREYIHAPHPPHMIKCNVCSWRPLSTYYCARFCYKGYIFRTTRIASSIFHL